MDYLLKSSTVLIVFYLCYQLFLKRETFFETNRWFLLSGLVVAIGIPLIVIPNYIEYSVTETSGFTINSTANDSIPIPTEPETFEYLKLVFWIYVTGILFFLGKLAIDLLSLHHILKSATVSSRDQFRIHKTNKTLAPFSFFNSIVYNPNQFQAEELEHVINHEKVHAQQYHSFDIIIAQIVCVLFWFNPFAWLYKKALQQNLEFIADQKAQYVSLCNKSYQTVLLKASVANQHISITNNFYTSLIKKRIVMLHKSKSNPLNRLKYFIILPVLAAFMMSFNVKDVYVAIPLDNSNVFDIPVQDPKTIEILITKDTKDEGLEAIKKTLKDEGITFTYSGLKRNDKDEIIAINAEFKSDEHSSNFNLKGQEAIKPFRFKSDGDSFSVGTVNKDGNKFIYRSDNGNTKVQASGNSSNVYVFENDDNDESNDIEVDVKSQGDNNVIIKQHTSGNTWISKDGTKTNINASENGNSKVFISQSDEPLFIVNGKAVSKSLFEDIDSDDIESVFVLKGKQATQTYGSKGKNGVIVMSTSGSKPFVNGNASIFHVDYGEESPLYIVDGKIIAQGQMSDIDPKVIDKVEVLKDAAAMKIYGAQAKNGAIIVTSKQGKNAISIEEPVIVQLAEDSPNSFKTAITSVYYIDDDARESIEFVITKNSNDAFLDQLKSKLKAKGVDAKFNKVRRNEAGEITSIKISLDDNQGRKSSASWKEKHQAIPDIVLGKSGEKLLLRAIGY